MVCALLLAFGQAPGLTVADTKFDLTQNPVGFLRRAAHLWTSQAPMGQVQNQAYGYFFPHGAFFVVGHVLGLPGWVTQRVWWAVLLLFGFWGMVRLAEALAVGSRGSRVVAGIAFALCPRVLTTLGSISSEALPMLLAPWVLLAPVRFGRHGIVTWRACARSAVAVAVMGAVNAVATVAAVVPALLWFGAFRPGRAWLGFSVRWLPALTAAVGWWVIPLRLFARLSPPFLDYIESAGVTTEWTSPIEVLRGTDSWSSFVSTDHVSGVVLVTQPAMVVATGAVAAAGMAGLAMRSMPARGRLALILFVGLVGMCAGYGADAGHVGSLPGGVLGAPWADAVRRFLDGAGAPLRNVHKLEPLVRIPLVLGLAQFLGRVPLPGSVPLLRWRHEFAHPERNPMVAVASLLLAALAVATSQAWMGRLAPQGAYEQVPGYWRQTARWLADNAPDTRALVLPGVPFGSQVWGWTRDEPLQGLALTPWAVRDAIPLVPPGAIRAMDAVQRQIAAGRPSAWLAAELAEQGIGVVVLRNDLDRQNSRSARPLLVHAAIDGSPGLPKVAQFGPGIGPGQEPGLIVDGDLDPKYPAIEIFRVVAGHSGVATTMISGPGAPPQITGARIVPYADVPVVQGGPEVIARPRRRAGPVVFAADAKHAGLPVGPVLITDTPTDRETDFGQVDNHSSAIRAEGDPRRTRNRVPDYPVPGTPLVRGRWSGARVEVSSSAADAVQLGGAAPGAGAAAAVSADPSASWISGGIDSAVGQWLQLDLDHSITAGVLRLTVSPAAIGPAVRWVEVTTVHGSVAARVEAPGSPIAVALPAGATSWVRVTATQTVDDTAGAQFGITGLSLTDHSTGRPVPVPIRHRVVVPGPPEGSTVAGWDLGQEFPGRNACFDAPDRVRCSAGLASAPEEPGIFERTLTVPSSEQVTSELTVRARPGPELEALLTVPGRPIARGPADVGDLRGASYAATDGNPRTSWIAPQQTTTNSSPASTLTVELPAPTRVTGLVVTPSNGQVPAHPTSLMVNIGKGPQLLSIPDRPGPVRLGVHPAVTSRIELSLRSWRPVWDTTGFGFVQVQPPGLAEVAVLGPHSEPVGGPPPDPDRLVTVDCAHGPVIRIGGRDLHTSVTAPAERLVSGRAVPAHLCGANVMTMPAGMPDVLVETGNLFTADRLQLMPTTPPARIPDRNLRILVVPLSHNSGFRARSATGMSLRPVVVDGWEQGWVLPRSVTGPVTMSFPADRAYRVGITCGLVVLVVLLVAAAWPARSRTGNPDRPQRTYDGSISGTLRIVAAVVSVVVAIAGVGGVLALGIAVTGRRWAAAMAGLGTAVSAAVLATGPWRSPHGYLGGSIWVQFPAVVAVAAVAVACFEPQARRKGCSTRP